MPHSRIYTLSIFCFLTSNLAATAADPVGYYRQPSLHRDTLVFVSEGDLWSVGVQGGVARRLTTHQGDEAYPAISPDGKTIAFVGQYEGPGEVYLMPLAGGVPRRLTYEAARIGFVSWTPDGKVLYGTDHESTLPSQQLATLDVRDPKGAVGRALVPLAQAADGCYDDSGRTLYFTRLPFQGSHTKRYRGGTAQSIWKYEEGAAEAVPLTTSYTGTSKQPLWWQGRVYFASDRDGTMNIWSMNSQGGDLRQHTHHAGWDVATPSLSRGAIAYQLGADIHLLNLASGQDRTVPITLDSDFDQMREHWVKKPAELVTAAHLSPDGNRLVLTARGRIFVAPHHQGRLVEVSPKQGVRYRDARFLPGGKALLAMSDESGEVEFWKLPANGVGPAEQLTHDGEVLRVEGIPSPDAKWVAHTDKNNRLFLLDLEQRKNSLLETSPINELDEPSWSPDSKWLAYVTYANNGFRQIRLFSVATGKLTFLTSDRFESYSPAWSPDGKWLYFLSDRNLKSVVPNPWGNYQPEPFLDKKTKLYQLALTEGLRSPFAPADELQSDKKPEAKSPAPTANVKVEIELAAIERRLYELPVPPGNYTRLTVNDKALFWLSRMIGEATFGRGGPGAFTLQSAAITNENVEVKTVIDKIKTYELSADGKKLLIHKSDRFAIVDAAAAPADLAKKEVNLSNWALSVQPRDEWRQMFNEAWRLERDYFYDRAMHGMDWKAMREKYRPLVERVRSRAELSDLVAQMVSELSALHIFVVGGDLRQGEDQVMPAALGGTWTRDPSAGGYRISHVYASDPDEPQQTAPLARPDVSVREGDVIEQINGTPTLSVADGAQLLRRQAGQQVLLRVKPAGGARSRDVIVTPLTPQAAADLRYHEWEHTRRLQVEKLGNGELGYVHLQAMSGANYSEWAKNFYPVFTRKGLIVDMRHNRGGNIDSWILSRLLRKAWFYWSPRVGQPPVWNMQYAFRGHVVVLCDEFTASDGEAFTEGFRRLGLGKVIGTRTWGGEIWLSMRNLLVDNGIASAAEMGVYGPEGAWLIEGHGVDPDEVVDNLPHATFLGEDAQLKAGIAYLQKRIRESPVSPPTAPPRPNKSLPNKIADQSAGTSAGASTGNR
jgi:tricorn protease